MWLDRVFGKAEEINGGERCPTYLFRWTICRIGWLKVYLHHFVADDWSFDLHDHPKRFVSIGLRGCSTLRIFPGSTTRKLAFFPGHGWSSTSRLVKSSWNRRTVIPVAFWFGERVFLYFGSIRRASSTTHSGGSMDTHLVRRLIEKADAGGYECISLWCADDLESPTISGSLAAFSGLA
jgi:hypothetical protein